MLDGASNGIKSHRWITNNLGGTTHIDPYSYLQSMGISEAQFKLDIKNGLSIENKNKGLNQSDSSMESRFTYYEKKTETENFIARAV